MQHIKESDWKLLRELKNVALERLCQRALEDLQRAALAPSQNWHERYLQVYSLIHERDKEVADIFNDLRRSTALLRLMMMRTAGLVTDEEMSRFSEETQKAARPLQIAE